MPSATDRPRPAASPAAMEMAPTAMPVRPCPKVSPAPPAPMSMPACVPRGWTTPAADTVSSGTWAWARAISSASFTGPPPVDGPAGPDRCTYRLLDHHAEGIGLDRQREVPAPADLHAVEPEVE